MPFPGLPALVDALDSLLVARFAATGELLHGNAGFLRVSADGTSSAWHLFLQPSLEQLALAPPDARGVVYRGCLTLGGAAGGEMRTLTGTVLASGSELLIVAGYDIDEFERVAEQMRELNDALDRAHRDLIRANRELAQREKAIREISLTDALTGVGNRRHLDENLAAEWQRARRYGQPLSLLIFDIDHFKRVNDTWGHEAGDRVLQEVGALLRTFLRDSDRASRLGGEEFVLLMPGSSLVQAEAAAERLRQAVAARAMSGLPGVTVSLGVAGLANDEDGSSLLARADAALYRAKQGGRNRVVASTGLDDPDRHGKQE
ncbi:diguanylate cyclase [Accumulibacter sp.]|uniref:GGDEF domain-containing protein n=1 Tax=Accumulibacter sp. TaxID=2053492 RepID=UPI0028C4A973|nr:diguanylate cyclase [Accumulibacter sp.]